MTCIAWETLLRTLELSRLLSAEIFHLLPLKVASHLDLVEVCLAILCSQESRHVPLTKLACYIRFGPNKRHFIGFLK